jgi:hypothetical protein
MGGVTVTEKWSYMIGSIPVAKYKGERALFLLSGAGWQ